VGLALNRPEPGDSAGTGLAVVVLIVLLSALAAWSTARIAPAPAAPPPTLASAP